MLRTGAGGFAQSQSRMSSPAGCRRCLIFALGEMAKWLLSLALAVGLVCAFRMKSTLQRQSSWPQFYFLGLEFVVLVVLLLITFGGRRGGHYFGVWPSAVLAVLLVVLLVSSVLFLRRHTALAVSGLLVFAAAVAAGFFFPVVIR